MPQRQSNAEIAETTMISGENAEGEDRVVLRLGHVERRGPARQIAEHEARTFQRRRL
jgi:hypothetical protein